MANEVPVSHDPRGRLSLGANSIDLAGLHQEMDPEKVGQVTTLESEAFAYDVFLRGGDASPSTAAFMRIENEHGGGLIDIPLEPAGAPDDHGVQRFVGSRSLDELKQDGIDIAAQKRTPVVISGSHAVWGPTAFGYIGKYYRDEVPDSIFVRGSNVLDLADMWKLRTDHNIKLIISLRPRTEGGSKPELNRDGKIMSRFNESVGDESERMEVWRPSGGRGIPDGTAPSLEQMGEILDQVRDMDRLNEQRAIDGLPPWKIFIHCNAGKGRTGAVIGALRIALHGVPWEAALCDALSYGLSDDQVRFIRRWGMMYEAGKLKDLGLEAPQGEARRQLDERRGSFLDTFDGDTKIRDKFFKRLEKVGRPYEGARSSSKYRTGERLPYLFGTLLTPDRPGGDTPIIAKLRAISEGKAGEKDLTDLLQRSGGLESLDSNLAVTVIRYLMRSQSTHNRDGRERALYKILKRFSPEELGDILRQIDGTANTRRVDHLYWDTFADRDRLLKAQQLIDSARRFMAPRADLFRVVTDWDDTVEPKNTDRPIQDGVAELYREITRGKPGDVHVVTACEFGAAANLKERMDKSGLEYGSVRMGDWDTRLRGREKHDAIESSKLRAHELVFERNPGGKFVVVCDDTQRDMEIVKRLLASKYADQIALALILRVNEKRPPLPEHPLVKGISDYREGAQLAHELGIIDDAARSRLLER